MAPTISFHVIAQSASVPSETEGWAVFLTRDRWDDWGKYCTQFHITVVAPDKTHHAIGPMKIGQRGLKPHGGGDLPPGHRKPNVSSSFEKLDEDFFSLGQEEDYYANLSTLGDNIREQILTSLRDVALDAERWEWAKNEEVMKESLLRFLTSTTVQGQLRRMARGDASLTKFHFTYSPPKRLGDGAPPFTLDFNVNPDSPIATNLHVLIGRNGVGKTRLLSLMAKALVGSDPSARQSGKFELNDLDGQGGTFANLVAVSFSAFDEAELLPERELGPNGLGYSYIGLRGGARDSTAAQARPKSLTLLAREFVTSLGECRVGSRRRRWESAIATLQADPVFKAAQISSMMDKNLAKEDDRDAILKTFKDLSSGHKIVLLTLTRLVEKVEEKTLVLIDEPEAHLHPPLLSAMTRAISELLVKRNGVAIIATHSPVILQEVPKSCVWILNRILSVSKAERPTIETFAESVGILSREIFQLELSNSGYHQFLRTLRQDAATYEFAVARLEGQLGAEGKAVLRAMYLENDESYL